MRSVRLLRSLPSIATLVWLTAGFFAPTASAASAKASAASGKPLILDTQTGISDGQSGTVLQTAPLSHAPIVSAQPMASPTELAPNSSTPVVVAPYVQVPGGGSNSSSGSGAVQKQPKARPALRQQ
jgi:hypothetical protein